MNFHSLSNGDAEPELKNRRFEEILPVSQFVPLYPGSQSHIDVSVTQVPPYWQSSFTVHPITSNL